MSADGGSRTPTAEGRRFLRPVRLPGFRHIRMRLGAGTPRARAERVRRAAGVSPACGSSVLRGIPRRLPLGSCCLEARLAAHVEDDHLRRPLGTHGARGDQSNDVQMSMHLVLLSCGMPSPFQGSRGAPARDERLPPGPRRGCDRSRNPSKPARIRTRTCEVGARRASGYTTGLRSGRPGSNGPPRSGAPVLCRLSYVREWMDTPGWTRTSDLRRRRTALCSAELRACERASGRIRTRTPAVQRACACR